MKSIRLAIIMIVLVLCVVPSSTHAQEARARWDRRAQIRRDKFELAACMSLEVGKNRLEALGDAEEAADLIDYYAEQMVKANGYQQKMNNLTPIEDNTDLLRPFGVFVCIAPFNFPAALAAGMSSAALVTGNTLVF